MVVVLTTIHVSVTTDGHRPTAAHVLQVTMATVVFHALASLAHAPTLEHAFATLDLLDLSVTHVKKATLDHPVH